MILPKGSPEAHHFNYRLLIFNFRRISQRPVAYNLLQVCLPVPLQAFYICVCPLIRRFFYVADFLLLDFQQYVIRSLQTIKFTMQQLSESVGTLIQKSATNTTAEANMEDSHFDIPVSTLQEFTSLCDQLKTKPNDVNKLVIILYLFNSFYYYYF